METSITMTGESDRTEAVNRMVIQYEKEMLKLCYVYLRDIHLAQEALRLGTVRGPDSGRCSAAG